MDRGNAIIDAKAAFIRTQVRVLSTPLQPSIQWRDFTPEAEDDPLPDKLVQDVVTKVNEKIKQHNRMVFSALSQRHVAEQIDNLYWNKATSEAAENNGAEGAVVVKKSTKLNAAEGIQSLPDNPADLSLGAGEPPDDKEAGRYKEIHTNLVALSERRDQQTRRLAQYKQLQDLLKPLEDAQENIQPNLVTRDGELNKELDRMRILLARVTGRIAEIKEGSSIEKTQASAVLSNEEKLSAVMDLT